MEVLKFALLFILICNRFSKAISDDFLAAKAIANILNEQFAKAAWTVEVINFGRSEDVLETVLRLKSDSVAVKVTRVKNCESLNLSQPSILFFDSLENFAECYKNIEGDPNTSRRHQNLVYIPGTTSMEIDFLQLDSNIDSMDFLTRDANGSIVLVTGFMFRPSACKSYQIVVINRFIVSTMKWEGSTFNPEKYENFHGCNLTIVELEEEFSFIGIYEAIASSLNFKLHPIEVENTDVDIVAALKAEWSKSNDYLVGFKIISDEVKFVVPPGELYTPLEKMFLPFCFEVWVAIFVTIFIGLGVIQIINRCSLAVRNIAFGYGNNTPTLNMASTFFAGYQNRMPAGSFARFILMLYIIWCLIFRTCYQSELFKHLQRDERNPGAKSLSEIIERNLTYYGSDLGYKFINNYASDKGLPRLGFKEYPESFASFDLVADPENKAVKISYTQRLKYMQNNFYRSGEASFIVLDETIRTFNFGLLYKHHNPYMKVFERKVVQLYEAGIPDFWVKQVRDPDGRKRRLDEIGPQVLTWDHLEIGFIVWLVPLALSILVFLIEIGHRPVRNAIRNSRDAIIAASAVCLFMNNYNNSI